MDSININLILMKIKTQIRKILLEKIMTIKMLNLRDFLKTITIFFF